MSKHSPGPFTVGDKYSDCQTEVVDANGRTLAAVWSSCPFRVGDGHTSQYRAERTVELQANLKLFTAAAEMLAALQMAVNFYSEGVDPDDPTEARVFNAACAAIAKATK